MSAANVTGKRKRSDAPRNVQFKKAATQAAVKKPAKKPDSTKPNAKPLSNGTEATPEPVNGAHDQDVHLQIVTGSYERVLHGICATIPRTALSKSEDQDQDQDQDQNGTAEPTPVSFSDTFLFAAHSSSIRCLTVSPSSGNNKRTLATGGSDERINLYSVSTSPPAPTNPTMKMPSLVSSTPSSQNSNNRSLGNLLHHDRAITALAFPSKSKLFSAAEDNTIAISRARDWTMLSSIRAPIPKPQGRPSGDTAGPGEVPAGVNDFAVHPSQKLMLSVGRGERCMRLWNLITGKKAGVLNFEREVLAQVGEGRFGTGEGRKVLWDEKGEVYVVGFERGAVVFGIDSKPKALIKSDRPTKMHQMRILPEDAGFGKRVLAISTEDGRVLFFDLASLEEDVDAAKLPLCPCVAQLGGRGAGLAGRIKDFEILQPPSSAPGKETPLLIVTASSDGAVRIWDLLSSALKADAASAEADNGKPSPAQVGALVGTLETSNRITCLGAFVLDGKAADSNGTAALKVAEKGELESGSDDDEDEDSE